ncbi:hypothetical protein KUTeg_023128 [Tegillarca granosa]|uniref:Uncharacterized protein n=1 Tax=Tegillarca granosa TaxID=220873 RepID=A0ABQ9E6Z5_TEGGR|nr:hypothetical protein KUTeg_023128 [Tegillarca granosa]
MMEMSYLYLKLLLKYQPLKMLAPQDSQRCKLEPQVQDGKLNMKSQTVIPCHRSESISSDLEMTLSLQEVGAPLDLSSRKLDDESDDSLDGSSCESTCTSFSSSDESVLNIPNDQVDLKTDSNLPCLKSTNQFNVCDNNILTLQTADNSKSKAVTSCTPFQSSFDEYISSSLDMTYMPAADMKPIFPTMCKIEPQDKNSCKSQYTCKINSSRPNLHSSTDTPGPVTFSTLPQKCNTHGDSTSNSILGTHAQGMDTAGISTVGTHVSETDTLGTQSSSSTDSMMHCSAPKKKKENASDSDDIWASLKKDLDFLSNLNDEILTVNSSVTTTKCLSNSESNGASNSSKSFPDMSNFQTSSDLKTSPNQNLVLTGSILPQSQTTGRPTAVIKSVSSFPSLLTSSSSIVCTSAGSSDSKQLPPKKQLRCFPLGKTVSCPNSKSSVSVVETGNKWGSEKCSSCVISLLGLKSSRCLQGHVTCGACLEERVKLVLTGKSKVSVYIHILI